MSKEKNKNKKQSIIETVRQINNQEALKKQEKFEKQNEIEREKYGKKNAEEKKEVLKVRQGIVTESEILENNEKKVKYTFWQKFKNFIYHNKWWLGFTTFFVIIGSFLIYDTVTTIRADVRVMLLTDDDDLQGASQKLHEYFNGYVFDYNEDDRQYTDIVSIPISHNMEENYQSAVGYENSLTNLSTQFQLCECMIILADSAVDELIDPDETLENLEKYYPECPYVDGARIYLKDTKFAELIGIDNEDIPDDLFLAVRKPIVLLSEEETAQTNYKYAMETIKKVIEDLE